MNEFYLQKIKSFEGFTAEAKWDYAQHSNGYGTKALFPGERIDRAEAEIRFRAEIEEARAIVDRHAGGWDEGTRAALTSLTYNAGTRWISSGLGDAIRAGDVAQVRERFVAYNKAQGEVLPGLVKRRLTEVEWIGAQAAPAAAGALAIAGPPGVVAAAVGAAAVGAAAAGAAAIGQADAASGASTAGNATAGGDFLQDLARALSWDELLGVLLGIERDRKDVASL